MCTLQRVLNAAARLVTDTRKYDRGLSTLIHDQLHWLGGVQAGCHGPSVSGEQSTKISGQLLHSSRRRRQSTSTISQTARLDRSAVSAYSTIGRRAFSVGRPTVWNSLPVELREPTVSNGVFRRTLKTILFARYLCTECNNEMLA